MCGLCSSLPACTARLKIRFSDRQLAIDLGVTDVADALALALTAGGDDTLLLSAIDVGEHVGGADRRHPPAPAVGGRCSVILHLLQPVNRANMRMI